MHSGIRGGNHRLLLCEKGNCLLANERYSMDVEIVER